VAAVDVQIITYAPTIFYHCQHCELTFSEVGLGDQIHREQAREALPEDLRREYAELSDEIHDVMVRWGSNVRVRVIDAASIEGVFKSLKYRTHRYPAIVVDGRRVENVGSLTEKVERAVARPEDRAKGTDGQSASRRLG
jgi:hypothetical protein